ncbi:MAG: chemotaxis protein CheB [Ferruginibacter sp.]
MKSSGVKKTIIKNRKPVPKKKPVEKLPAKKTVAVKKSGAKKTGAPKPFPVVGIGASAGGLEAFSVFLENLPANLGMAYVFIQHLSPDHESFLPEIFHRKTKMKVHQVKNNMPVEKNNVYVIPANHSLEITDGKLKLVPRPKVKGSFHPVDNFFTSLAKVYSQNAIGIILSGTGTDGTLGMKVIKAEGGIGFAQDDSAKYAGMPHNAAELGYVDFVMSPDKIAKELASIIIHPYNITTANEFMEKNKTEIRKILFLLHNKRNIDFSHYKQTTIQRRIMRRMLLNRFKNLSDYTQMLRDNNSELEFLYQDLLICVTNFFRDPGIYKALTNKILPALLKEKKAGDMLRIWIPGCATGEEAISFAIVILEYLGKKAGSTQVQIFATDLNERAIERSRSGMYMKNSLQNVSAQRLKKYFVKTNSHYQVIKPIRDICIFAPHNLLKDPPFSRIDIISCQNVLIYLEANSQHRIMRSFHYALKYSGFLLLGKSESIGSAIDLFEQQDKEDKIYTKKMVNSGLQLDYSTRNFTTEGYVQPSEEKQVTHKNDIDLEKETDKLLLTKYVPATVLVNKDLEILRFRGVTSAYLEPAAGKASLHLMKMVKEEISHELRWLIHSAKKSIKPVRKEHLSISINNAVRELSIEVVPIKANSKDIYFLIIFQTGSIIPANGKKSGRSIKNQETKRINHLEQQLKEARNIIRIMGEEFETNREDLQSANEEVLSSNEELQSINEELETSKEELQSTNEELTTINEELQLRNVELRESGDYSSAILETMHECLLILNSDLRIKTANKGFFNMFGIIKEKAEGLHLFDLGDGQWDNKELRNHIKKVQSGEAIYSGFEMNFFFERTGIRNMLVNTERLYTNEGKNSLILLAIQDITPIKQK